MKQVCRDFVVCLTVQSPMLGCLCELAHDDGNTIDVSVDAVNGVSGDSGCYQEMI